MMAVLRTDCDWKSAQTHRTLARYLLEEAHETLEAIDDGDRTGDWDHLREELGDLLLQVVFHAEIASERGDFDLDDVAAELRAKLLRRNPHVFGDDAVRGSVSGAASVNELWQAVKATENPDRGLTDGLPPTLPALLYADKVLERLERAGSSSGPSSVVEEGAPRPSASVVEEGPPRPSRDQDLGDRLLALVAEAHASGTDPEQALRDAVRRLLDASGPYPRNC